jgi:hypothetical protein
MVMLMSKTIKQIADEIGIDKQKAYRYIKKNHIKESHQKSGVMYYDEATEKLIVQAFSKYTVSSEAHQNHINDTVNDMLISMLQKELEIKNKQIEELNLRLAEAHKMAEQAQQLHGADKALELKEAQEPKLLEEQKPKKRGLFFWR